MPIDVLCGCGKKSTVADEHAGKEGRCGACGAVNLVPIPALESVIEDLDAVASGGANATGRSAHAPYPTPIPPVPVDGPPDHVPITPPDVQLPSLASMPSGLEVRCHCGKKSRFRIEDAGQHGQCPQCNAVLELPKWVYLPGVQRVNLVDAELPFGSMCWLVFKWTLATIPTVVALAILYGIMSAIANGPR